MRVLIFMVLLSLLSLLFVFVLFPLSIRPSIPSFPSLLFSSLSPSPAEGLDAQWILHEEADHRMDPRRCRSQQRRRRVLSCQGRGGREGEGLRILSLTLSDSLCLSLSHLLPLCLSVSLLSFLPSPTARSMWARCQCASACGS